MAEVAGSNLAEPIVLFAIGGENYGRHEYRNFWGRSQRSDAAKVLQLCSISRRHRLFSAQKKDAYMRPFRERLSQRVSVQRARQGSFDNSRAFRVISRGSFTALTIT